MPNPAVVDGNTRCAVDAQLGVLSAVAVCHTKLAPLTQPADIDAVFKQGKRLSSEHFALHWHISSGARAGVNFGVPAVATKTAQLHVAFVVSKRHAKRAVRRNAIRRVWRAHLVNSQIQLQALPTLAPAQVDTHVNTPNAHNEPVQAALHVVVRLAKPFGKASFLSAASAVLKRQISGEAADLLTRLQVRLQKPRAEPVHIPEPKY